jgi:hypothetical protein
MCVVTEELCEKRLSQIGQRNGFWPAKGNEIDERREAGYQPRTSHLCVSSRVPSDWQLERTTFCSRDIDTVAHLLGLS